MGRERGWEEMKEPASRVGIDVAPKGSVDEDANVSDEAQRVGGRRRETRCQDKEPLQEDKDMHSDEGCHCAILAVVLCWWYAVVYFCDMLVRAIIVWRWFGSLSLI